MARLEHERADDFVDLVDLLEDEVQFDQFGVGRTQKLGKALDAAQGSVQVVGDATGQKADGFEFASLLQFPLALPPPSTMLTVMALDTAPVNVCELPLLPDTS